LTTEWNQIGPISRETLGNLRLCPHILNAEHWDIRKSPRHKYALSYEEKRAALERESLKHLLFLEEETELVTAAAPILQSKINPQCPPDLWFRDAYDLDNLIEAKNLWYRPLDTPNDTNGMGSLRFFRQSLPWLNARVFNRSWNPTSLLTNQLSKIVDGHRTYDRITIDPTQTRKIYVSTIPSFNSEATESALFDFFEGNAIFLEHPMPDIHPPFKKELSYSGRIEDCVTNAAARLQRELTRIIEDTVVTHK